MLTAVSDSPEELIAHSLLLRRALHRSPSPFAPQPADAPPYKQSPARDGTPYSSARIAQPLRAQESPLLHCLRSVLFSPDHSANRHLADLAELPREVPRPLASDLPAGRVPPPMPDAHRESRNEPSRVRITVPSRHGSVRSPPAMTRKHIQPAERVQSSRSVAASPRNRGTCRKEID